MLTIQMKNGKEFLLTDTVGFIQKLPTMLVRWFTIHFHNSVKVVIIRSKLLLIYGMVIMKMQVLVFTIVLGDELQFIYS